MSRLTKPYCFHPSWDNPVGVPLCQLTLPPLSTTHLHTNSQLTTVNESREVRTNSLGRTDRPRSTLRHLPLIFRIIPLRSRNLIELVENTKLSYLLWRWPMISHDQRCAICLSYFESLRIIEIVEFT